MGSAADAQADDRSGVPISQAAAATGIPARLLRYYEEQGLLAPARNASGYRRYRPEDLAAARHIRQLLAAGLGTAAIGTVLPCLTERAGRLAPVCADTVADLQRERARIDAAIEALSASRQAIDEVIAAAAP